MVKRIKKEKNKVKVKEKVKINLAKQKKEIKKSATDFIESLPENVHHCIILFQEQRDGYAVLSLIDAPPTPLLRALTEQSVDLMEYLAR